MSHHLTHILNPLSRQITVANEQYLYFGGTAYLGIPQHSAFHALYLEGIKRFGINNGTSRNNNVQLGIYNEVEAFAAAYFGAEDCLITSSGYLAAQLTVKKLSTRGELRYAPATHPALWLNSAPPTIGSFQAWSKALVEEINQSKAMDWVILSNSLNNLYPEVYDFSFIEKVDQRKKITLIVDDSHGIGLLNEGKGIFSVLPKLSNVEIVVVASMAKALGTDAGVVLASKQTIFSLKQSNEFLGASPPAAAGLYAFMHAEGIYEQERLKLQALTSRLRTLMKSDSRWRYVPELPVFLSADQEIAQKLLEKRILISSFAYPDQNGALINRIVLSSWHTFEDIEELILALAK
jgi:8-amino-7-oxononanoate synthase